MNPRTRKHAANIAVLRLAAESIRQQLREVAAWSPLLGDSDADRVRAERALRAFAARLDRAAAAGTPEHVALLLGEALASIELPEAA